MEKLLKVSRVNRLSLIAHAPLLIALCGLIFGGLFLLQRADRQARDTTRKHHLEDIESALYFAQGIHGTYPPYNESSWCGTINLPANQSVKSQIEQVLRQQNEQYANPAKPFPADPIYAKQPRDYFYWKHSPTLFELYAVLEDDSNGERTTARCRRAVTQTYDYGITSALRQNMNQI